MPNIAIDWRALARAAAWPLLVTAGVFLLLAPGLGPDVQLAWRDTTREYGPLRPLVAEALHAGRLPLWDPYDGLGIPLLAQYTHGALHPASLLLALVAPGAHVDALLVAYVLTAGLGAYAAARTLGAAPAAAAAAGLGFAGSGYVLSAMGNLPFLAGTATLPWLLAAAQRAGAGRPLAVTGLAVAAFAEAAAGDVQTLLVGLVLAVALAIHAGGLRALPRTLAGLGLGGLLAAVQLLPTRAALAVSWRVMGLTGRELAAWSLLPYRIPELLVPGWLIGRPGDALGPVYMALEPDPLFSHPFSVSIFVGAALLVAAAASWRIRAARPLLLSVPLLLWLALGSVAGGQQLLHGVPVWGTLRYAEKLVGPLTLVLCLLGALGLSRLAEASPARGLGALAAVVALLAGLSALPGPGGALFGALLPEAVVAPARAQAAEGLAHVAVALGLLCGLLLVGRRRPALLAPGFAALVLLEAAAATPFALYPQPATAPSPPVARDAAPPPGPRLLTPSQPVFEFGTRDALRQVHASSTALGLPGYNVVGRVDNVDAYASLLSERLEWARGMFATVPAVWRRYGATHVVLPPGPLDGTGLIATVGGRLLTKDEHRQVWRVTARDWASFAPQVMKVRGLKAAVNAVLDPALMGTGVAFLDVDELPLVSPGRVLSVARGTEAVAVEAEAAGPAVLVVNDAWWPGWEAELDGAPTPILVADGLVRAVVFPPGRHRLVMRYDPPEVRLGLWLSGAGLALLAATAWWERRRARPPG